MGTNNPTREGRVTSWESLWNRYVFTEEGAVLAEEAACAKVWMHRHGVGRDCRWLGLAWEGREAIRLERSARSRPRNRDHRVAFERDLPGDYRGQCGVVRSQKSSAPAEKKM